DNIFEYENVEFSKLYNNDNMDSFSRNYLPFKDLTSTTIIIIIVVIATTTITIAITLTTLISLTS
ncbi:12865_t:CDS:2, partial [Funneliformis caledonium]